LWEFQSIRQGHLPDDPIYADELEAIANSLIAKAEVNKEAFPAIPRVVVECVLFNFQFRLYPQERGRTMVTSAVHEFAPVCAVVGGMLAQDILKALGVREAPLANFFTFDGSTGGGNVVRMSMA
jgi:ubiquitin-like 1-activating enzyme E1 A